ncbi:MAG: FadR family transcriptional regulator [Alphaproteobacteria bacterium]|nr:FadR family transcriptional regulator [Alphaproteobacteria bacterium]
MNKEQTADKRQQRTTLAETVFNDMYRAIKSGAYSPDERLPTEYDLAAEFEVSRPIVREALQKLRDQNLIYSRRGAGSFVRQNGLKDPLGFGHVENLADLRKCYEFRAVLEPAGAEAAARRRTAEDLKVIFDALEVLKNATERHHHRSGSDFLFHLAIAKASGNQYFSIALEALEDHIAVGMKFHGLSLRQSSSGLGGVYSEHKGIYEAIRDQNAEAAHSQMAAHIEGSRSRLFDE